jgi:hypothetical protein
MIPAGVIAQERDHAEPGSAASSAYAAGPGQPRLRLGFRDDGWIDWQVDHLCPPALCYFFSCAGGSWLTPESAISCFMALSSLARNAAVLLPGTKLLASAYWSLR